MTLVTRPFLVGAALLAAGLSSTSTARAQNCETAPPIDALALDSGETRKCGTQFIKTVTLGSNLGMAATITVEPYDPMVPDSGFLHIKAENIHILPTGIIDANYAGYRGSSMQNAPDRGPAPGGAVPGIFTGMAAPGGGGAAAGNGGQGSDNCVAVAGAEGGMAYLTSMDFLDFDQLKGSAGGASRSTTNNYIGRGGHGGGVIILEAHTITIDGELRASGEAGLTTNGADPGGGGGGSIFILANTLTFGADAALSANGGDGGVATVHFGAGGGGGLIVVSAEGDLSTQLVAPLANVQGGTGSATCCEVSMVPFACGGPGIIEQTSMTPACIDADGDNAPSELCGGTDCNDANPEANPAAMEKCDGVDNNCDGQVDEDPNGDLCPLQQVCSEQCDAMMNCVIDCFPEGGAGGGGGAGPQDQYLRLGGGLCTCTNAGNSDRTSFLAWLLATMAGAFYARRRHSVEPTRAP